jgi:hypothetical protein
MRRMLLDGGGFGYFGARRGLTAVCGGIRTRVGHSPETLGDEPADAKAGEPLETDGDAHEPEHEEHDEAHEQARITSWNVLFVGVFGHADEDATTSRERQRLRVYLAPATSPKFVYGPLHFRRLR